MRLIDAEHLKRWILARWEKTDPRSAYPLRAIDIIDQVDREDTIDAEPVVRCKDCHYAKPYNKIWQLPKRDTLVCTHFANDEVDNNFFCGYAIKKMDEVNDGNDNNET